MYSFSYRLRERFDWALCSIYLILESGFFAHGRCFAIESVNVERIQSFHSQFLLLSVEVCFILENFSRVFPNFKSFSYFLHCMFWKKYIFWWFADIFACIRITTSHCIFFSAHFSKRFSLLLILKFFDWILVTVARIDYHRKLKQKRFFFHGRPPLRVSRKRNS